MVESFAKGSAVNVLCPNASLALLGPRGWRSLKLGELWAHRDLFWLLAWRDVKVRYKQTALGVGWAILQPVMMMVVFGVRMIHEVGGVIRERETVGSYYGRIATLSN